MSKKPTVFIGSSKEANHVAEAVAIKLEDVALTTSWTNAFDLSSITIVALLEKTKKVDHAVFVFHADDEAIIRDKQYNVVRDNVLFELGLFVGALGLENCFILVPSSKKQDFRLPSDLSGITVSIYNDQNSEMVDAVTPSCAKIKISLQKIASSNEENKKTMPEDTATEIANAKTRELESSLWNARIEAEKFADIARKSTSAVKDAFFAIAKPATELEIEAWEKGAEKLYSTPPKINRNSTFILEQDCVIPSLHGASAVSIIVMPRVRIYGLDQWSHNTIYYMDGFRKDRIH